MWRYELSSGKLTVNRNERKIYNHSLANIIMHASTTYTDIIMIIIFCTNLQEQCIRLVYTFFSLHLYC